ncbi:hypothetical protein F5Y10DRAFT_255880 [Nemania abortiva]|nr:hypothetical protein F5Y10DRAFT_255880 [Nemania abortiva]
MKYSRVSSDPSHDDPTSTAYEVCVDGIELEVPDRNHCWDFKIEYSCGCPVRKAGTLLTRDLIIRVKKDNHTGPCYLRRCLIASETLILREQCVHCEIYSRRVTGTTPYDILN